jgi:hypothetical protein
VISHNGAYATAPSQSTPQLPFETSPVGYQAFDLNH